jgi:hypothetical protein
VCATTPAFSSWLICEGFPFPPFGTHGAPPSLPRVFFVVIVYYSFSLFSLGGGQSVHGAMLIWPRVVYGNTAYRLAHLVVCVFQSHLGTGVWRQPRSLLVSLFNMKWRCSAQAGSVEGSKLASSQWFCL